MKNNLADALNNVEVTYQSLVEIANSMLSETFSGINYLVSEISSNINNLSVDQIRDYALRCQLRAYEISEMKDKSAMKAAVAESLQKEKFAEKFNEADGAAAVKNNIALLGVSEEIAVEKLYDLVADLLKTKLDQLHRLVDTLKSILMSRMQEAKLTMNSIE